VTSNFGPSIVHELRFSRMYGEYRSTAYFQGQGAGLLAEAGVTGLEQAQDPEISSLPALSFSGYAGFSGNAGDGRPKWQDRGEYEITDNLTWIKGSHIMKFGGRIYRRSILFTDARDHNGTYGFTGVMTQNPASAAGTGDGFADFLLGYPANSTRSNPATWWGGYGTYWHGFFQDEVKVANTLTVNLGIRYEYTPWLTGYRGQAAAFDPTREKSIIVSSKTSDIDLSVQRLADVGYELFSDLIQTSSQAGVPLNITKNDKRQFAPRLGFAWRPFGQDTVVRGGYGIFYEAEGTDGRLNFNFIPFRVSETLTASTNVVPTRTLADYWLGVAVGSSLGSVTWIPLPLEARPGRDQRWNFGFQHQLFTAMALEVDYVGTTGDRQTAAENINLPPAGPGNVQLRRPYPRFGNISMQTQAQSSDYHALQIKAQQRPLRGLWDLVSYTYSTATRRVPTRRSAATTPTSVNRSRGIFRTSWPPAPATSCRSARDAGSSRTPDRSRTASSAAGSSRASSAIEAACRSRPPSRATSPTSASAVSGRTGSDQAAWTIPRSTRGSTRRRSSCPSRSLLATRVPASCAPIISGTSMPRCSSDSRCGAGRRWSSAPKPSTC
jgi:hypothetical protein